MKELLKAQDEDISTAFLKFHKDIGESQSEYINKLISALVKKQKIDTTEAQLILRKLLRDMREIGTSEFEGVTEELVGRNKREIEAARLVTYKAACAKDDGKLNNGLDVALAKYLAGEIATKASNFAMRILGAYGYSTEYPVARYYRDAPTYSMVEGSANICKWIIALDQLGFRKANR